MFHPDDRLCRRELMAECLSGSRSSFQRNVRVFAESGECKSYVHTTSIALWPETGRLSTASFCFVPLLRDNTVLLATCRSRCLDRPSEHPHRNCSSRFYLYVSGLWYY